MAVQYEHTQFGTLTIVGLLVAGLVGVLPVVLLLDGAGGVVVYATGGVLVVIGVLFHSLTVKVSDADLVWYFGPGFWRKQIDRDAIERVEVVRNTILHGWGIRKIPGGWLYNVSGLDAVEVETTDGTLVRIGTDEPERLASVLRP